MITLSESVLDDLQSIRIEIKSVLAEVTELAEITDIVANNVILQHTFLYITVVKLGILVKLYVEGIYKQYKYNALEDISYGNDSTNNSECWISSS